MLNFISKLMFLFKLDYLSRNIIYQKVAVDKKIYELVALFYSVV